MIGRVNPWAWDWWTALWVMWIVTFFVLEVWTLANRSHNELTAHLRPVVQFAPPVWFGFVGLWLWLGFHFLIQGMDWQNLMRVG